MQSFEALLAESAQAHGHLCPGQVVGVRMAMLGCRLIGLNEPTRRDQIKKLIVYVEMDRCTADAVAHVTGVKLGRRSLKFVDYGIMAATFMNLETGKAFRSSRPRMRAIWPKSTHPRLPKKDHDSWLPTNACPTVFYSGSRKCGFDSDEYDLPGPTRRKIVCSICGQVIRDRRESMIDDRPLCRPCSGACYFSHAREVSWPDMNWSPGEPAQAKKYKRAGGSGDAGNRSASPSTESHTGLLGNPLERSSC